MLCTNPCTPLCGAGGGVGAVAGASESELGRLELVVDMAGG